MAIQFNMEKPENHHIESIVPDQSKSDNHDQESPASTREEDRLSEKRRVYLLRRHGTVSLDPMLLSLVCSLIGNEGCAESPSYGTMGLCRAITAFFISPAGDRQCRCGRDVVQERSGSVYGRLGINDHTRGSHCALFIRRGCKTGLGVY